jgi:catechol 2,3-dioxygenase
LYADTPERGTWGFENGQFIARDAQGRLRSGRDPLDLDDLFRQLQPGDRLDEPAPPQTKVGHVHLHIADVDEAVAFYCGVLGFEPQIVSAEMGAAFISAGGYHHHLGLNTWVGRGAPPPPPGSLGLRHFEVVLPHPAALEAVLARVRQAGIAVEAAEGGSLVRDPSRNAVVLTARPAPGA